MGMQYKSPAGIGPRGHSMDRRSRSEYDRDDDRQRRHFTINIFFNNCLPANSNRAKYTLLAKRDPSNTAWW
jgi:hypothetical protein